MIAVDTNVLARNFERDDPRLTAMAEGVLSGKDDIFISNIVLCELAWVLQRVYRRPSERLAEIVRRLMDTEGIRMDRDAARVGLHLLELGGDFSDGVVLHEASRMQCRQLATFDRKFARLGAPDVVLVS